MQYTPVTIVLIALSAFAPLITASSEASPALLPGYVNANITWTIPTGKGDNVTFTGTLDQVQPHFKAVNPDWVPVTDVAASPDVAGYDGTRVCCPVGNWNWPTVNYYDVHSLAARVNQLFPPGSTAYIAQGTCGEISCYVGAGAWACADSTNWNIDLGLIAQYIGDIGTNCPVIDSSDNGVCGQNFDPEGFNVIVHAC